MTLLFALLLVGILFYAGLNLAESGTNSLLGQEDSPRAFRILSREGGEVEIYWSGSSRRVNMGFFITRAQLVKDTIQDRWQRYFPGDTLEAEEEPMEK